MQYHGTNHGCTNPRHQPPSPHPQLLRPQLESCLAMPSMTALFVANVLMVAQTRVPISLTHQIYHELGPREFLHIISTGEIWTFDTYGSLYDTWLHIFPITSELPGGTLVLGGPFCACDDCGGCGTRTVLEQVMIPVGDYVVIVDGFSTSSGLYTLLATCGTSPPTTPAPWNDSSLGHHR